MSDRWQQVQAFFALHFRHLSICTELSRTVHCRFPLKAHFNYRKARIEPFWSGLCRFNYISVPNKYFDKFLFTIFRAKCAARHLRIALRDVQNARKCRSASEHYLFNFFVRPLWTEQRRKDVLSKCGVSAFSIRTPCFCYYSTDFLSRSRFEKREMNA